MPDNPTPLDAAYALGRIEGKLDLMLPRLTDHEARLDALEHREQQRIGRTGLLLTLATVAGSGFTFLADKVFS